MRNESESGRERFTRRMMRPLSAGAVLRLLNGELAPKALETGETLTPSVEQEIDDTMSRHPSARGTGKRMTPQELIDAIEAKKLHSVEDDE